MEILIQRSIQKDFKTTEHITRETFWNLYIPGCNEHLVLDKLRKSESYVGDLDLIAILKNEIVGHIISSKGKIIDSLNNEHEILCVGPLSVYPKFQNSGIGSKLIRESIKVAKALGYLGMILYGNPQYYHRFGFVNAEKHQITTKDNQNFEPFMVLETQENGLANVNGRFFEDDSFSIDEGELIEFERQFPFKEKLVTETQFKH